VTGIHEYQKIPLQITHGCLVASVQVYLDEHVLTGFQDDLLNEIRKSDVSGVILDVSGVSIIDSSSFTSLRKIMSMISIMGARSILVGIRAGVVASLIDLDVDLTGVEATMTLEQAFEILQPEVKQPEAIIEEVDVVRDEDHPILIEGGTNEQDGIEVQHNE